MGRSGPPRYRGDADRYQLTRRILPRFGVRTILLTGPSITGLGQVWLHTISNTGSYQVNVLGGIMLAAFGMD